MGNEKDEIKKINLTPHHLNFTDGKILESSGVATIEWIDDESEIGDITLVSRIPVISGSEIARIEKILGDNGFGIVSFPVVSAVRGTRLEGKVGSVIMSSRTEKVAFPDRFAI